MVRGERCELGRKASGGDEGGGASFSGLIGASLTRSDLTTRPSV